MDRVEDKRFLPHDGCKYFCECLVDECDFFISEYLKHALSLGLTVEEYIDFTSTLYEHCQPNFRKIDETTNFSFIMPKTRYLNSIWTTYLPKTLWPKIYFHYPSPTGLTKKLWLQIDLIYGLSVNKSAKSFAIFSRFS